MHHRTQIRRNNWITLKTIHSGFEPVAMKLSITQPLNQLRALLPLAAIFPQLSAHRSKLISAGNRDSACSDANFNAL